ncbi:MAG TPA: 50S ribosomal protein L21 [Myxococcota bacterium]|jgi:large subunit ribosomal protein L21|nr:50S ribosomal protein L21 [Myxococcota bacterium]
MFAVVRTGGRQFRVEPGAAIRVEKLEGSVGDRVELGDVLMVGAADGAKIGAPLVEGAKVVATITAQDRGPKLTIFKFKRRKRSRRKIGHRQSYTEIRVDKIEA